MKCIPFRHRDSAENEDANAREIVEVLMINSTSGPGLLFPKVGGWENDETVQEAAVREAIEEAGVRGELMNTFANKHARRLLLIVMSQRNEQEAVREKLLMYILGNIFPSGYFLPHSRGLEKKLIRLSLSTLVGTNLVAKDFLGDYKFKSKTHQDEFSPEGLCKAAMFALFVKEELDSWPEMSTRKRTWLTIPEAVDSCRHAWMRDALENGFSKWYADRMMPAGKDFSVQH
ncbi:Nudix hydrolase 16, mitochondrial [Morella rubra]|uniref:Nudix hydrolase 16, mitochondrial n=1 Tax=Morella rubra TaxID=262757 RepID=A0A6A1WIP1_9ROSI|nr:Nudix hydrolase 16, mitochondrial [Morella rubra]